MPLTLKIRPFTSCRRPFEGKQGGERSWFTIVLLFSIFSLPLARFYQFFFFWVCMPRSLSLSSSFPPVKNREQTEEQAPRATDQPRGREGGKERKLDLPSLFLPQPTTFSHPSSSSFLVFFCHLSLSPSHPIPHALLSTLLLTNLRQVLQRSTPNSATVASSFLSLPPSPSIHPHEPASLTHSRSRS